MNIVSLPIVPAVQNSPQSLDKIFLSVTIIFQCTQEVQVIFLTLLFIPLFPQESQRKKTVKDSCMNETDITGSAQDPGVFGCPRLLKCIERDWVIKQLLLSLNY